MKPRAWLWFILGLSLALATSVFAQRGPWEYGGGWELVGGNTFFRGSGAAVLPLGTAALPSLTFAGNTTNGISLLAGGGPGILFSTAGVAYTMASVNLLQLKSTESLAWAGSTINTASDVILVRNAANVLQQLNGTNTQTFFVGGTSAIGVVRYGPSTFANLPTPGASGATAYCSDCDPTATKLACTHVGAQTGAFAIYENAAWLCL